MPPCGGIEAKPRRERPIPSRARKLIERQSYGSIPTRLRHLSVYSETIEFLSRFPGEKKGGKKKREREEKSVEIGRRERERERKNKSEFGKIGDETWMEKEEKGREKI